MAPAVRFALLLALGACGRLDFAPHPDGAVIDGPSSDASNNCLGTGAFTNLHAVANVSSTARDNGGEISRDGLALYFNSDISATSHIVVATRASQADEFSAPTQLDLGVGPTSDPSLTEDQLEVFFDRSNCIERATRPTTAVAFGASIPQTALCTTSGIAGSAISANGLVLLYNSTLDNFGEGDLYASVRATRTDEFTAGTKLANVPTNVGYPWVSTDKLRLYFEHTVSNGIELYAANRISPSDNFTNVAQIAELDSDGTKNVDVSLSPDESVVYFSSDRAGGTGNEDIWTAARPCL